MRAGLRFRAAKRVEDFECGTAEIGVLRIDASKAQRELGWRPRLPIEESVEWTSAWYQGHLRAENARQLTLDQIRRYQQRWPVQ